MKKNTGKLDRIIRLIIALLIGILYFTNVISGTLGIVLLVFAVILLITSITGFCGIYTLFGINTCKTRIEK
ncbi:MAG TPA: DUF2892 domain-containing protein [Bacteroidales bacterium]|nr:DUF2892 domain-containing protein [Bacteroidales bacterium]HOK74744.1 DUF2892 domain-containing protein [Bacteroidales bacterium]HOM40996.1 DUF2892 domain-containing protein [Bacteroidales bacterium]HPP92631.1 DUF2892 domain-containing protein [Bacteroidales bacterium]HQG56337.1 DUF2892 domain-containing protein [Bacteroidales bacterium]